MSIWPSQESARCRQRIEDGEVGAKPGDLGPLVLAQPADFVVGYTRGWHACGDLCEPKTDHNSVSGRPGVSFFVGDLGAYSDADLKFFFEFAMQCCQGFLSRLNLAAWELPEPGVLRRRGPPRGQQLCGCV